MQPKLPITVARSFQGARELVLSAFITGVWDLLALSAIATPCVTPLLSSRVHARALRLLSN